MVAKGLAAGPGAATGKIVFNAPDAEAWNARGEKVLLVRIETSPEDIRGMDAAQGILTARGGMTSHAALVARQMGKICVVGCEALDIDYRARTMTVDGHVRQRGRLGLDRRLHRRGHHRPARDAPVRGAPGAHREARSPPRQSQTFKYYSRMMAWADAQRRLLVRANADQPDQAVNAIAFGAQGIGLCRTEHMFFGGERITAVREMILADDEAGRQKALAKLLPMQRGDFAGLFRAMGERPVTIRTLDPPLHEFLPHDDKGQAQVAAEMGVAPEVIKAKVDDLHEANPMLGLRGCRLGITYPEITRMQVRAILEAACEVKAEGVEVHPEIMIPLVGAKKELDDQAAKVREVADEVFAEQGVTVDYLVGTMIEIPRAALTADQIAETAQFFSFGTNDLTQMTFGISRDDAGKFIGLVPGPRALAGRPVPAARPGAASASSSRWACRRAARRAPTSRSASAASTAAIPRRVKFCHRVGMNYVSCSPFRIPVARLAAAQAVIEEQSRRSTTCERLAAGCRETSGREPSRRDELRRPRRRPEREVH